VGRLTPPRDPRAPSLDVPVGTSDTDPIFVIGCQRSGTSLVRRILDSHSRIACPPETSFIMPLARVLHDRRSTRGFVGMGYEPEQVASALGSFIASFYEGYAATLGKPRWADKTPHYVDCLDDLWTLFGPRARFVVIVRDGMDVAFSLADPRRRYPAIKAAVEAEGGNVPVGAGRFWAEQNRKILDFVADHTEACHLLRYETLTTEPEAALEPMFAFLDEPWEPEVVDYARFEHHAGLEDPDVARRRKITPNSGGHRAWPLETQDAVRAACEPVLTELGYG
jgi:hypothetical protein